MSNTVEYRNVTIRMEKETKEEAERLFADLGINMTAAVNMFVKQAVREQAIPFDIAMRSKREDIYHNLAAYLMGSGTGHIPVDAASVPTYGSTRLSELLASDEDDASDIAKAV